jgi:hypothetical protein
MNEGWHWIGNWDSSGIDFYFLFHNYYANDLTTNKYL